MLTKEDLKWTYKLQSIYSKLMIFPVTFRPNIVGGEGPGQMDSETPIWKRVGFKIVQILVFAHTFFISFRTLEYMSGNGSSGLDLDKNLDWDLVPMMLIFTATFVTMNINNYLIFDVGREVNAKVYNETLKLRGM